MANPNVDVLGPPPSYDSVVYGSDGGSGPVQTGSQIPPPHYPTAPYTYPVPPVYPTNPGYPTGQSQYPTVYNTSQPQCTTIVYANEQPQPQRTRRNRIFITIMFIICFFVMVIIIWNLYN